MFASQSNLLFAPYDTCTINCHCQHISMEPASYARHMEEHTCHVLYEAGLDVVCELTMGYDACDDGC